MNAIPQADTVSELFQTDDDFWNANDWDALVAVGSHCHGVAGTLHLPSVRAHRLQLSCLRVVAYLLLLFTLAGAAFGLWKGHEADHATVRPIETYRVGERVIVDAPKEALAADLARLAGREVTWNASDGSLEVEGVTDPLRQLANEASSADIAQADYRKLILQAQDVWPDGTVDVINVETLQPWQWIHENEVYVGGEVPLPLDVEEMGISSELSGKVVDILRCPKIKPGRGRIILTTVNHLNRDVRELTVEDETGHREPLRTTGSHIFYSRTSGAWLPAAVLQPGERLDGLDEG